MSNDTQGAIQRAELFRNVDELIQFKELIAPRIKEFQSCLETILQASSIMVDTDTVLGERIDKADQLIKELTAWTNVQDVRVAQLDERIDVYNKRVRVLEKKCKHNSGEIKALWRALNEQDAK